MAGQEDISKEKNTNLKITEDKIGKELLEQQIENLTTELKQFEDSIKETEARRERYCIQTDVDRRIWELRLEGDNCAQVTPTFKYHEVPEFWGLVKKQLQWAYEEWCAKDKGVMDRFEYEIKTSEGQIKSATEKLAELRK